MGKNYPFLLKINSADNGRQLTVPVCGDKLII